MSDSVLLDLLVFGFPLSVWDSFCLLGVSGFSCCSLFLCKWDGELQKDESRRREPSPVTSFQHAFQRGNGSSPCRKSLLPPDAVDSFHSDNRSRGEVGGISLGFALKLGSRMRPECYRVPGSRAAVPSGTVASGLPRETGLVWGRFPVLLPT